MVAPRPRRPLWRAALPAATAAVVAALACELPRPTAPHPDARVSMRAVAADAAATPDTLPSGGAPTSVETVRAVIRSRLPDLVRESAGRRQEVWVVQRADGGIDRIGRGADAASRRVLVGRAQLSVEDSSHVLRVRGAPLAGVQPTPDARAPIDLSSIPRDRIQSVEVLRVPPGRVVPDSLTVVWFRLRPDGGPSAPGGATALSASAPAGNARIKVDVGTDGVPNGISSTLLDEPLVIVDGREVAGIAALPSRDRIRSVDVLKGDAAVRAYGSRAALGGVVVVTTKPARPAR